MLRGGGDVRAPAYRSISPESGLGSGRLRTGAPLRCHDAPVPSSRASYQHGEGSVRPARGSARRRRRFLGTMSTKAVRITHRSTGIAIAEGPVGWGITPFEGNYYIRKKYLRTDRFQPNFVPGLCIYKFLYVWLDLCLPEGGRAKILGWMYWIPNPLFPFIWFRVAVPKNHPELTIEEFEADLST